MKRYTILNSLLFLWIIVFEFLYKSQGYFLSIFARQDVLHYLIFGPIIIGFTAFALAYQIVGFKKGKLKKQPQNIIAIVLTLLLGITAFFTTEFYMRLVSWFQMLVIVSFVLIIVITTVWNFAIFITSKKANNPVKN